LRKASSTSALPSIGQDGPHRFATTKNSQYVTISEVAESQRWSEPVYPCPGQFRAKWRTYCERVCKESKGEQFRFVEARRELSVRCIFLPIYKFRGIAGWLSEVVFVVT
jgi:hypothetical protein